MLLLKFAGKIYNSKIYFWKKNRLILWLLWEETEETKIEKHKDVEDDLNKKKEKLKRNGVYKKLTESILIFVIYQVT